MPSPLEKILASALGSAASTAEGKALAERVAGKAVTGLRWLTRLSALGYLGFIVALWQLFGRVGEQNLLLAFGLYLPPSGWALPMGLLLPMALVFDWKSLGALMVAAAIVANGLMGVQWHSPKTVPAGSPVLTVLTFNRGESKGSLQPFKNAMKPDVVLLQDAYERADRYVGSAGYEEFKYGDNIGQFTILSRFPVTSKELIADGSLAVAARFTLGWNGQSVVLYDVHLPTPREPLHSLYRGAFMWGLPGPWGDKRQAYQTWWNSQISHAKAVIQRAEAETLPCLLAGDTNAPVPGYIHRLFTRQFVDSHEAAGKGCGMSFPGVTHNPLSLGGPWMRIDKILCNAHWSPLWNQAEPNRPSQHRAVAAAFVMGKK